MLLLLLQRVVDVEVFVVGHQGKQDGDVINLVVLHLLLDKDVVTFLDGPIILKISVGLNMATLHGLI